MTATEFKQRTKHFAISVVNYACGLPEDRRHRNACSQLIRSSSSVAANYRASCRARSPAEFIAKLGIVEEEADETLFWLEYVEGLRGPHESNRDLQRECSEIVAMIVKSIQTARRRQK